MPYRAPPGTRIGHVHLRVADLDRSIAFYGGLLGFQHQARIGDGAAFLAAEMTDASGTLYHHHIGLSTWQSRGGTAAAPQHTGLYHFAILYPDRRTLAVAVDRVSKAGVGLTGASDHGISEAVYLNDPDRNGIELCHDRPLERWPRTPFGDLVMDVQPLDVDDLLSEIDR